MSMWMEDRIEQRTSGRAGFTLVELLVVIAIIAILAGILIPTIGNAIKKGEEASARTGVKSIVLAIQAYHSVYGKLPVPATHHNQPDRVYTENNSEDLIKVLIGEDDKLNPRKRVFLENEGGNLDGEMLDPWGSQYLIKMDNNYDNKVEYNNTANNEFKTIAVVVSYGIDGELDTADDIASHEE